MCVCVCCRQIALVHLTCLVSLPPLLLLLLWVFSSIRPHPLQHNNHETCAGENALKVLVFVTLIALIATRNTTLEQIHLHLRMRAL